MAPVVFRPKFYAPLHPDQLRPASPDMLRRLGFETAAAALVRYWTPHRAAYEDAPQQPPIRR